MEKNAKVQYVRKRKHWQSDAGLRPPCLKGEYQIPPRKILVPPRNAEYLITVHHQRNRVRITQRMRTLGVTIKHSETVKQHQTNRMAPYWEMTERTKQTGKRAKVHKTRWPKILPPPQKGTKNKIFQYKTTLTI